MEDHVYTNFTPDSINHLDFTYKMSEKEIEDLVKLRISNSYLFSGKRNTSKWAWRAILKHMGLHHKMTHRQASKKFENLKKRYKQLKNPPEGVKVFPETWPFFSLMEDAMMGRLEGNAPVLKATPTNNADFLPVSSPKKRRVSSMVISNAVSLAADQPEIEVSLNGNADKAEVSVQGGSQEVDRIMLDIDVERNITDRERQVVERERDVMERERLVLEREKAVLDRDRASLDRERLMLERDRAMLERERAVLERERVMVDKDKDTVGRERLALEQEKAMLEMSREKTEEAIEDDKQEVTVP